MEKYNEFAKYYDYLMEDVDYKDWYGFIRKILQKEKVEYKTVLEMGCGTGNMTEQICKDENVTGITCFDISETMLTVAKEKLGHYNNLEIIRQDMKNINISKSFDLIISACDSVNYITKEEDLKRVFEKSFKLLKEKGVLLFDINSYYKLSEILGDNTYTEDREDVYYVWENEFEKSTDLCNFYLTFFIKENNADLYRRFDEHHIERAYREKELINVLRQVGFTSISTYYDFDFHSNEADTAERVFFCCKKGV